MAGKTLYDKVWAAHVVHQQEDGTVLLYIDRHLVHEVTSPQAFEGLQLAGRQPWRTNSMLAVADHNVPTEGRDQGIADPVSKLQVDTLDANCEAYGIVEFSMTDKRQGIVHVVGPEQGATLPGMTVVCGDSHTSTHGAFGALAFGIGTSEVEHVMATQCLLQKKSKSMLVSVDGKVGPGVTAKDIVEAGARAGVIAVDQTTTDYLLERPFAPRGEQREAALIAWRDLHSDSDATFDKTVRIDATTIEPQVSWGTSPEMVTSVNSKVPNPANAEDHRQEGMQRALEYMDLAPDTDITAIQLDRVFIGSCTNSRIEDLRAAAAVIKDRKVAGTVKQAMVVPGSGLVKAQAEAEGLDKVFAAAGFEWRDPGCSMCLAMNADKLEPGERCASTSNRNFEGRQGAGGRTHLVSPAMAAAAALAGHFVDVRSF